MKQTERGDQETEQFEVLCNQIRRDIHAIRELNDPALQVAVTRTWAAAMQASPYADLRDVPQSPAIVNRPLYKHVNEVNDFALAFIKAATSSFELPIDFDLTLATAILHDVDKPLIYRRDAAGEISYAEGTRLADHGRLGADLALAHGVPAAIAELVRVHSPFASTGLPQTPEGTVIHYADVLANDLAALQYGSWTIHCGFKLVPKQPS